MDLEDIDYFDLSALWQVNDGLQLRTGINNLFDREPPIAGNGAGTGQRGQRQHLPRPVRCPGAVRVPRRQPVLLDAPARDD